VGHTGSSTCLKDLPALVAIQCSQCLLTARHASSFSTAAPVSNCAHTASSLALTPLLRWAGAFLRWVASCGAAAAAAPALLALAARLLPLGAPMWPRAAGAGVLLCRGRSALTAGWSRMGVLLQSGAMQAGAMHVGAMQAEAWAGRAGCRHRGRRPAIAVWTPGMLLQGLNACLLPVLPYRPHVMLLLPQLLLLKLYALRLVANGLMCRSCRFRWTVEEVAWGTSCCCDCCGSGCCTACCCWCHCCWSCCCLLALACWASRQAEQTGYSRRC
jgi:hypothetical protein